jgi:CheY-like chemotaxis protein
MTATPSVVLVDDEPAYTDDLAAQLRSGGEPCAVEIVVARKPSALCELTDHHRFTSAVVDLSFGRFDPFGADIHQLEQEQGIDAIDHLREVQPDCVIAVMTRLDTSLVLEMAAAIRQTWPDIVFLDKRDDSHRIHIRNFIAGQPVQDNVEAGIRLRHCTPLSLDELEAAFYATGKSRGRLGIRIFAALAEYPEKPARRQLALSSPYTEKTVSTVLSDIGWNLRQAGIVPPIVPLGVELWEWSRARRPLLARLANRLAD